MIDIHVHIHCPDLVSAAGTLAAALDSRKAQGRPQAAPETPQAPTEAREASQPAPAPQTAQAAPAAPQPEPVPQPQGFSVPMAAPAQPAAVAPAAAPVYSVRDIVMAGAALLKDNAAIRPKMTELLNQFGLKTVNDLQPDQTGAFADALRQLGAKL